jgi:hypothetical protein
MKHSALVAAALLLPLLSTQAAAQGPQGQHVCHEDAFRLCQAAIPDHQRIFACLVENQRQLSAACRALIVTYSTPQDGRSGSRRRYDAVPN